METTFWTLADPLPDAIETLRESLEDAGIPWGIDGGWALDLAKGAQSRPHGDVDIAVFREDQFHLRSTFPSAVWLKVMPETYETQPWPEDEYLELPLYSMREEGEADIEWLLMDKDEENWVYRYNPAVRMPAAQAFVMTKAGVPVVNPAIVLLTKSRQARPKDEQDFKLALNWIPSADRQWLAHAIGTLNPEHPWLEDLNVCQCGSCKEKRRQE